MDLFYSQLTADQLPTVLTRHPDPSRLLTYWVCSHDPAEITVELVARLLAGRHTDLYADDAAGQLTTTQLHKLAASRSAPVNRVLIRRDGLTSDDIDHIVSCDDPDVLSVAVQHPAASADLRDRILAGYTLNPRARIRDRLITVPAEAVTHATFHGRVARAGDRHDHQARYRALAGGTMAAAVLSTVARFDLFTVGQATDHARRIVAAFPANQRHGTLAELANALRITSHWFPHGLRQLSADAGHQLHRITEDPAPPTAFTNFAAALERNYPPVDRHDPDPHTAIAAGDRDATATAGCDTLARLDPTDLDPAVLTQLLAYHGDTLPGAWWSTIADRLRAMGATHQVLLPPATTTSWAAAGRQVDLTAIGWRQLSLIGDHDPAALAAVITPAAHLFTWPQPPDAAVRFSELSAYIIRQFGDDDRLLATFASLVDDFTGTLAELLTAIRSLDRHHVPAAADAQPDA